MTTNSTATANVAPVGISPILTNAGSVDPWAMQRALMAASDQNLPGSPELNKGVLLYARLNLEEGSETLDGLQKALKRILAADTVDSMPKDERAALESIALELEDIFQAMKATALRLKPLVSKLPDSFRQELLREEVIEMADGATDLTVTNSGFACALGIDGAACYLDVGGSNLSKANPDDGKIHKEPDGKWIKDKRTYREPNLAAVIYGT